MMRAMRQITKPVFWIVALSFVGWMAYGQVTDILGGGRDVVLNVNGQIVRVPQFQSAYQAALENHRRQGGGRLTREDEQQLQNQVTDELIRRILLDREYRRLGIAVADDEVRRVARSTPPPQILRQVLEDPTFQTDGKFDIAKWQRYLATAP
jgi:peptidyl-prolyl cis-trans isomerase D